MVAKRILSPKPIFDEGLLAAALEEIEAKTLHITSIWSHLVANKDATPAQVPGLPHGAYTMLEQKFATLTSKVASQRTSADGTTTKLLVELQDGMKVEAVIMRHDASAGKYNGAQRPGGLRATLCISSQVGCQMGCTFCATGTMGMKANLAAGEIVEQLVHALRVTPIRNIVFMGMGEPLNNYDAVRTAVRAFTGRAFGLSPNHITVSTVGVIPRMLTLTQDMPGVNLALSLHAPSQELRLKIVPAARAYPLTRLMAALDSYMQSSGRSVLVEYVMLRGVNDSRQVAQELGALLQHCKSNVVVNLIPYNPTSVDAEYQPSTPEDVVAFQKILREGHGIHTTVRQEMGQDINGACGQLVVETGAASEISARRDGIGGMPGPPRVRDIEEMCGA
eukprot:jgi/Mesen1/7166/ME000037S06530